MPPSISIGLAAARQAAAIGPDNRQPPQPAPPSGGSAPARPVTPAKPPGTGLLIDTRV